MIEITENELIYRPDHFNITLDIVTGKIIFPDNFIQDYLHKTKYVAFYYHNSNLNIETNSNKTRGYRLEKDNTLINKDLAIKLACIYTGSVFNGKNYYLRFEYQSFLKIFRSVTCSTIIRSSFYPTKFGYYDDKYYIRNTWRDNVEWGKPYQYILGYNLKNLTLYEEDYEKFVVYDNESFLVNYPNVTSKENQSIFEDLTLFNSKLEIFRKNLIHTNKQVTPFLYWKVESDMTVSFLDIKRYKRCLDEHFNFWENNLRQKIKLNKFLNMFLDVTLKELEDISNLFKRYFSTDLELKEFKGEDIKYLYLETNYDKRVNGDLHNSCMRYASSQSKLKIYTENPNQVSCLGLVKGLKVCGRALIWNTSEGKVMDRIYVTDNSYYKLFRDYAEANNIINIYLHRKPKGEVNLDNMGINSWCDSYNKKFQVKLYFIIPRPDYIQLNLKSVNDKDYPYMDNFAILDLENKALYNCSEEKPIDVFDVDEYNNNPDNSDRYVPYLDGYYDREQVEYSNHEGHWLYLEDDDVVFCVDLDEFVFRSSVTYYNDDYFYNMTYSEFYNDDIPEMLAIKVTDKYGNTDYILDKDLDRFNEQNKLETVEEEENE